MVRVLIVGVIIAVAFTLYALIDAAMTEAERARGVSKPVWVVLIVVLPVIGGILWFTVGRGRPRDAQAQSVAPDDDPAFGGKPAPNAEFDAQVRDLERRLQELDDEVFPGEERRGSDGSDDGGNAPGTR